MILALTFAFITTVSALSVVVGNCFAGASE